MGLYHKYRPQTVEEMLGNEAQLKALEKGFAKPKKDWSRAYLVSGPSGCGKTTLARLIAKVFLGGNELNIREVNTADNRGIDTAREIIESMKFIPAIGGNMIYIIDECHMTTKEWQNAMLKPLEDGPDHVYFFLCTTDPQKMLPAIHTRCTQIKVESQPQKMLYRLVKQTAKAEGISVPEEVMQEISLQAGGSPRAALVLLEKVMGMSDTESMLEACSVPTELSDNTIDLCRGLLSGSWEKCKNVLKSLKDQDSEKVRRAVTGYMSSVVLGGGETSHKAAQVLEAFSTDTYSNGFPGVVLMAYIACHTNG